MRQFWKFEEKYYLKSDFKTIRPRFALKKLGLINLKLNDI